jgi:hypothetical protein
MVLIPADDVGEETPDQVAVYALLEGDVGVMIEPGTNGSWKMNPVPDRLKTVLWGRYPDRKLSFPKDPIDTTWRRRRPTLPLQQVNPARINLVYAGTDLPGLVRRRGQAHGGDWDSQILAEPFAETRLYRALEARFKHGTDWQSIPEADAVAAGQDDQASALAAADQLYESIKSGGYRPQRDLGGTDQDEILAALGREGRYVLLSGAKRLAIARVLGLASVPVNVVARHPRWEASRQRIISYAGRHEGRVYQRVLHPDLVDLQAHHDEDRLPIIKRALAGYDPHNKKLVDIGAHWGQMSAAMENLGFDVTAVEANAQSAKFTRTLRTAMEYRFEVWEGSIFEFPQIGDQNVVLALNIFHHFLKAQETYDGLVSTLQRLNADILIFAAHVYERRGPDFVNAYRNYPPEEFAKFVSEHSRLPQIELMGKSHDGRSLFKLSRH